MQISNILAKLIDLLKVYIKKKKIRSHSDTLLKYLWQTNKTLD